MRKIIVASHGEFSKGLKNSLQMIVGDLANEIETYSLYPSCSPMDYKAEMEKKVQEHPEDEFVFLCDVKGGSVHSALSQLCQYKNVVIFCGVNMNLLLDLLLSTPESLVENTDMQNKLLESGKEGIEVLNLGLLNTNDEEEDF